MLQLFRKLLKDEKGFTLMELMVVVVIIGILAAIAVPAFSNASDRAKVGKAKADIRTLESGLAMYYAEYNEYPDELDDLEAANYVKAVPNDPWGNKYQTDGNGTVWTKDNNGDTIYSSDN